MTYIAVGFIFGLFIPYIARRFAKFMPATFACAVIEIFCKGKKAATFRKTPQYKKFLYRSALSGLLAAAVIGGIIFHFAPQHHLAVTIYALILLLLAEIDHRTYLLPDILTIPLLIFGFFSACTYLGPISYCESAFGAMLGYFLPTLVSLFIVWYKKDAFGGGDIKLLSAIGAFLGIEGLVWVIACSSVLGLVYALICHKKELAFGPMIALAGIIVAFCLF